jgi:hypothetical protein
MKSTTFTLLIVLLSLQGFSQNVLISDTLDPNEPSIIIDPKNPNILIAGANLDNYYISKDTGHTWSVSQIASSYGVWGDPVVAVDTNSDFYFFHLANMPGGNWIDRIVCQKSTDTATSWSDGTYTGLNGTKAQDKQWCAIDRNKNYMYLTWTQFDAYGSDLPADSSNILFSKSTDGGINWTSPLRINQIAGNCTDRDTTVEGAVPCIGPNGEIYVAWAGKDGIYFDKSTDEGANWLANDIHADSMPGGWDFNMPGIYRCNGLPVTACDISGGQHNGTIYINWADQRNGVNNTDIWLSKSTNGGNTWSAPIKVNDDTTQTHQFFTWMTIDQTTGYLYFVFYDRRAYNDSRTDVYMAISKDGGATFTNKKISDSPFVPDAGIFFGDYTNIIAHNNIVRPIWTRLNNGQLSIWTDITPMGSDSIINSINKPGGHLTATNYPNPASDLTYVSFKLHEPTKVSLIMYDMQGREVMRLLDNTIQDYGKHIIPISVKGLKPGSYVCKLLAQNEQKALRVIVVE